MKAIMMVILCHFNLALKISCNLEKKVKMDYNIKHDLFWTSYKQYRNKVFFRWIPHIPFVLIGLAFISILAWIFIN